MTEENSNRGLTNVQKARNNNWEARDLKHFKIRYLNYELQSLETSLQISAHYEICPLLANTILSMS
jgi:hypothetical protein